MNLPAATANRDAALVVFCRRPRPGVGKQRLAATLGVDAACVIAAALLACTLEDLAAWPGPIVLAPADVQDADWAQSLLAAACRARGDTIEHLETSSDIDEPANLDWLRATLATDPRAARRELWRLAEAARGARPLRLAPGAATPVRP